MGAATQQRFPSIAALVYFDAPTGWELSTSPVALEGFRALGRDPYFAPR